ncbi:MAG: DUF1826 domain-containing protein [Planctomycetota bacterium]
MIPCTEVEVPAAGAVAVAELSDLGAILDRDVQLATWVRPRDPRIEAVAAAVAEELGPDARVVVRCDEDDLGAEVTARIPAAAFARDAAAASAWRDDVVGLCEAFAELVQAAELMISLEGPAEATCPRFHVDRVGIRLLTTYSGPGTEWLAESDVDRAWLGEPGQGRQDDQNGVMRPGATVRAVAPFSVALLKGEAWPGAAGRGAVHRSPDPAGAPRVLLRVDMLRQRAGVGEEVAR